MNIATQLPITTARRPGRRAVRVGAGAIVALVLLGASAAAVSAATGRSSSSVVNGFRTATVTRQSVNQTIANVGSIEPVSQASVAFPIAGTVQSVAVKVGEPVALGDELAELGLTSLKATLTSDEASLSAAKLTLHQAVNGETITNNATGGASSGGSGFSGTSGAPTASVDTSSGTSPQTTTTAISTAGASTAPTTTVPATTGPSSTGTGTSTGTANPASSTLTTAQQAVLNDQKKVDADLAAASRDLSNAGTICQTTSTQPSGTTTTTTTTAPSNAPVVTGSPGASASSTAPNPSAPVSSSTTTTTTPNAPAATGTAACSAALRHVLADQQTVAADQNALATASTALDNLIGSSGSGSSSGKPTTGSTPGAGIGTGSSPSGSNASTPQSTGTQSGSSSPSTTTSTTPTAAQLVAYQAAVDAASLQVEVAKQGIAQATIASPISGTVVGVNMHVGDTVTAGSSTEDIIIQGSGGFEVSTTVDVNDISSVKVGQSATVTPDGGNRALEGRVVAIGIAANTSSATPTYPVVIGFTEPTSTLRNGQAGDVSIVIDHTHDSLAVPTSAVTTSGTNHTVTVLVKGKETTTTVQIGAVGPEYTAITSGLTTGQLVVLADLSTPLPGSATATATTNGGNGAGGFGGFGGAGGPPAGVLPGGGGG